VNTPGLVLTEHEFSVPLDHAKPDGETITVFAREVAEPEGLDKPFLVFLQGGPGFEAPRPTRHPTGPGWLDRALQDYRVLMLDERGTGRSTPVGSLPGMTPREQADYLVNFRADSIVRDAEIVRKEIGVDRWSVLGQSFGGFCSMCYLSIAPEGLREAMFTGGVPPIAMPVDTVYARTYERAIEMSRRYYERYPADRERVLELRALCEREDVRLPSGDRLTPDRVRSLGHPFGFTDGFETAHYLLEQPFDSRGFLYDMDHGMGFNRNPIYAVLHESSYSDGFVTNWSAERLLPDEYRESPELFTGEHVFKSMFEDYGSLHPLREAAEVLAQHEWNTLFDADVLAGNEVPAAAAIYNDDIYVDRDFSEATVEQVRGMRKWVTSEYLHNGLRADGGRILGRLIDLVRGR
jgi:pimeloyl-ACP methyl ester carboxylesterase